ncbi:glucose-1-phosphate cytidylyltransferase [Polynucleobacter paludilacus]|uniref:glucose-1-phosphate cytidylyltransferase n=1 Tax=Polynucleobacter paludilacus TaxID=1855895 RepID=UPI001BFE378C|nr:glucose-1-phosphate cytidylyltransferase [Polynucleobacter paludilacus]QWD87322.1 glucose-1-phosphate cytidylyltransferase [Polynucleobacter paludilacus]
MKVLILAGGFGTRLGEYTTMIPKPMVNIGDRPILWHIMKTYAYYGHCDFNIALGYKAEVIKNYFLNYSILNSDFSIHTKSQKIETHNRVDEDWKITLVDTGLDTMTGGRLKRMRNFIGNEPFLLTYGDGVADVDINSLISFHKSHGKLVTVTAVRPAARFGELGISKFGQVTSFQEKPQVGEGWINGGYFVIEPAFLDFIDGDKTVLERDPLEAVAQNRQLMAFPHTGFWQCMDTKRDRDYLEDCWGSGKAQWKIWT